MERKSARHAQPPGLSVREPPIDDGTDFRCDDTGEPSGLARLEARPVTTLCVEAQERRDARNVHHKHAGHAHGGAVLLLLGVLLLSTSFAMRPTTGL